MEIRKTVAKALLGTAVLGLSMVTLAGSAHAISLNLCFSQVSEEGCNVGETIDYSICHGAVQELYQFDVGGNQLHFNTCLNAPTFSCVTENGTTGCSAGNSFKTKLSIAPGQNLEIFAFGSAGSLHQNCNLCGGANDSLEFESGAVKPKAVNSVTPIGVACFGSGCGATGATIAFNNSGTSGDLLDGIFSFDNGGLQGSTTSAGQFNFSSNVVPEPSTYISLFGGLGLLWASRKRKKDAA